MICKERIETIIDKKFDEQDGEELIPLLVLSGLIFVMLVGVFRYSVFLYEILTKDLRWCRRLRNKKLFMNYDSSVSVFLSNNVITTLY